MLFIIMPEHHKHHNVSVKNRSAVTKDKQVMIIEFDSALVSNDHHEKRLTFKRSFYDLEKIILKGYIFVTRINDIRLNHH